MNEDIRQDYYQTIREFMEWRGKTTASLSIITEELDHIRADITVVRSDLAKMRSDVTEIDKKCIQHLSKTGQIAKEITSFNRITERLDVIEKQMVETATEVRINRETSDKRYKQLAIAISVFAVVAPAAIAIISLFL